MINVIGCESGRIIAQVKQREYQIPVQDFAGWVQGFVAGYDTAVDDGVPTPAAPAAPAPAAPAPAAQFATEAAQFAVEAYAEKPLTVEDVRRAFKELEANGVERATITAAIKKYGKTLPEVPADKLQELLDEVRKCN